MNFYRPLQLPSPQRHSGFTMVELLVSIAVTGILASLITSALGFTITSNQKLANDQARRTEMGRALEMIADDVHKARFINKTVAGATRDARTAVNTANTSSAFNPALALGTAVLYLEVPVGNCGPTAIVDRVIYDVRFRSHSSPWRGPQVLYRYGRVPGANGEIDPCSAPVADTVMADGITASAPPRCDAPAVLSGLTNTAARTGFYTCANGTQVTIALYGQMSSNGIYEAKETISSRVGL
jgi:prepilin-type N-terminal cleavage/methylation domain-containing protein